MKKFGKVMLTIGIIIAVIVLSLVFVRLPIGMHNYAEGFSGDVSKSGFIDTKGLFSNSEASELDSAVKAAAEALKMNLIVCASGEYRSDLQTEIYADDQYDEVFGEDTDGVFYYMDLSGKSPAYDYISTSGRAVILYQSHVDNIFYALDSHLPSSSEVSAAGGDFSQFKERIASAVDEYLAQLARYADGGYEDSYYYDSSSHKYVYRMNGTLYVTKSKPPTLKFLILFLGEILGLIVGLIVYFSVKSTYKFKNKTNPSVYISHDETAFSENADRFMRTHTSRHRIESSSGGGRSGGGGGGHSHSGGHGGGGHHR